MFGGSLGFARRMEEVDKIIFFNYSTLLSTLSFNIESAVFRFALVYNNFSLSLRIKATEHYLNGVAIQKSSSCFLVSGFYKNNPFSLC